MKTMLVPVDFTDTSDNAVDFAVEWSRKFGYERIILFKTFYESMFEYIAVSADFNVANEENMNAKRVEATTELERLNREINGKSGNLVSVMVVTSEQPLLRGLLEILQSEEPPELILAGSDYHTGYIKSFISSNIIAIAKASPVKVLIVPSGYRYKPVKNILVPCDINSLTTLSRLDRIKNNPKLEGTRLQILNVNIKGPIEELNTEKAKNLHEYLKDFPHQIYYTSNSNIINGILDFTKDHEVELIMALPGRHSFLYSLTNKSISEAIYCNARQPVLILK